MTTVVLPVGCGMYGGTAWGTKDILDCWADIAPSQLSGFAVNVPYRQPATTDVGLCELHHQQIVGSTSETGHDG